jgi:hypothetical protein
MTLLDSPDVHRFHQRAEEGAVLKQAATAVGGSFVVSRASTDLLLVMLPLDR